MRRSLYIILFLITQSLFGYAQFNSDDMVAYQYYQKGEYDKAALIYERLFEQSPNENYFDFYLNALLKTKQFDVATQLVKKQLKNAPSNPRYVIASGRILQEKGEADKAAKIFNTVLANLPDDEFRIRELANSFYQFEAYDLAIAAFEQGRKKLNNPQAFNYELLSLFRFRKDKNRLIAEYMNVLPTVPQLLPQAQNILGSIFESDADYQLLQTALLKKLQKSPDAEVLVNLLIWQYLQQKSYDVALKQLIAQDTRLQGDGLSLYQHAGIFAANGAYPTALAAYEYLITKGNTNQYYLPAKLELINIKYTTATTGKTDRKVLAEVAAQYQSLLQTSGRNTQTLQALKRLANLQAYYLDSLPQAEAELENALKIPGLSTAEKGQLKMDLGDIYILTAQPWEAILMYEQVAGDFENQIIGNDAKFRAARLSFYQGNFVYAKSQADVLKASTSQLIANDALNLSLLISDNTQSSSDSLALKMYADAELLNFRNLQSNALLKLDSISIKYPKNTLADDILMAKSRIFIKSIALDKAVATLQQLVKEYPESLWIDDAIFTLGDLYENQLHNTAEASLLYQRLINEFPGSMFTADARLRFRKLRGDNTGT